MAELGTIGVMWFTMEPDVYGGKSCDKIVPRWKCFADGDKDSDHQTAPLKLDARLFPPGTKITVTVPACPECGEPQALKYPTPKRGPVFVSKCRCGFDWDEWTRNEYS